MITARRTGRTAAACRELRREDERLNSLEHRCVHTHIIESPNLGLKTKDQVRRHGWITWNGVPKKRGGLAASEDAAFSRTSAPSTRLQPAVQLQTGNPARKKTKGLPCWFCLWMFFGGLLTVTSVSRLFDLPLPALRHISVIARWPACTCESFELHLQIFLFHPVVFWLCWLVSYTNRLSMTVKI